jgi:ATP-dependent helicase Lhr and Lhr-like helicase
MRWGVLLRDLLVRETLSPPWRDLLPVLRRMEARGEIRGGRFVAGLTGEQFARPEALDLLRMVRRQPQRAKTAPVSSADPLNLGGIILPGPRVSRFSVLRLASA